MEETPLKDLDKRLQKQVENAKKALDKNSAYAVDILANIVNRNPSCLEARQILRKAQQKAAGKKSKGMTRFMETVSKAPFMIGGDGRIKKDPEKVMQTAEGMLGSNPENSTAHELLGQAATELGLHETAAFAYEELLRLHPGNAEYSKALMRAYIQLDRTEEAVKVGDAAYRQHPEDDEIQGLIRQASVQQSIEHGKWDEEDDFRSKLKDEDEAVQLEQQNRAKTGESGMRSLIEEAKKKVEQEPESLNHYREIASNYRQLGEYDNALEWLEKGRQLEAGKADPTLEREVGRIKREKMEQAIREKEEALENDPENEELKQELERLRQEERTFRVEQAERMVKRYPNEFGYRYELGELYLQEDRLDDAIKELQLALRNPKVRLDALILLGKAYKQKTFYDLAAEQLEVAKSEISAMNDQKKEVLYELGECYELQGDSKKAIAEFKTLYGADIGYRDVAEKIDAYYSKKDA